MKRKHNVKSKVYKTCLIIPTEREMSPQLEIP